MTVAEHISSVCRISVMEYFLRAPAANAVAAAETLRRHTLRLLLRQQGRCGVTLSDCCCGSRDVAASHSHTAVAAAETLRRHSGKLLLRQQGRCQWWLLLTSSCGDRSAALAMKLHRLEEGCQTSPPFSAEAKWFLHMPCRQESASVSAGWLLATCEGTEQLSSR